MTRVIDYDKLSEQESGAREAPSLLAAELNLNRRPFVKLSFETLSWTFYLVRSRRLIEIEFQDS